MSQDTDAVELVPDVTVDSFARAVLIAALVAGLSYVSIRLPGNIPFSFQHFGVFLAGLVLGPLWGGLALLLWIVAGLVGAPVYSSGGAGLGYFLGPTGGFIVGFLLAGVVVGAVVHRSTVPKPVVEVSPGQATIGFALALVPIYAVGVPWFAAVQGLPLGTAVDVMIPFAIGDLIKVAVAGGAVFAGQDLLARIE
ncbi:MAG: biotin transporter BioY [Haloarculaceae archaeon]